MPRISEFYGIVIALYFADHAPPHFHAIYAEHEATVDIETASLVAGSLPARAEKLVKEWSGLHRDELRTAWEQAQRGESLGRIAPLP